MSDRISGVTRLSTSATSLPKLLPDRTLTLFPKALKSNTYVAEKLNCLELFHARPDARFEALLRLWVSNRWRIDRPRSCLEPAGFNHHVSKHVQDRQPERRQQARTADRSERDLHLTAF